LNVKIVERSSLNYICQKMIDVNLVCRCMMSLVLVFVSHTNNGMKFGKKDFIKEENKMIKAVMEEYKMTTFKVEHWQPRMRKCAECGTWHFARVSMSRFRTVVYCSDNCEFEHERDDDKHVFTPNYQYMKHVFCRAGWRKIK